MKTVKKMAAIVLVGAMALSIAACKKGAKKVSADDFKKACEEVGLTVSEGSEDGLKQSISATNEDNTLEIAYMQAESTDDAKDGFEYFTNSVDSLEAMGAKVDKSSTKIEASVDDLMYMYAVRADDTIITVSASGEDQVSKAKDVIKTLGI